MRTVWRKVVVLGTCVVASVVAVGVSPIAALSTSCESQFIESTLGRRDSATIVASDSELVVWGGDRGKGNDVVLDGKVLDLNSGAWADILPRRHESSPVAVLAVAPHQFLLTGAEPAVYDTVSRSWKSAPIPITKNPPLLSTTPHGIVVIPWHAGTPDERMPVLLDARGTEVIRALPGAATRFGFGSRMLWAGSRATGRLVVFRSRVEDAANAATEADLVLDVSRGRWSALPPAPVRLDSRNALVTTNGSTIYALGVAASAPSALTLVSWKPGATRWSIAGLTNLSPNLLEPDLGWRAQLLVVGASLVVVLPDARDPNSVTVHVVSKRAKTRRVLALPDVATRFTVAGERLATIRRDGSVALICIV